MKIIYDFPPNLKDILKEFEISPTTVFTYGDTIYNPGGGGVSKDLMTHEETHMIQQGDDPEGWWKKYIEDKEFRLSQEVEAYKNQYKEYCKNVKDRNYRARFLMRIVGDLSSKLYGNIISFEEAKKLII